jgi:Retrotransposon gag protein
MPTTQSQSKLTPSPNPEIMTSEPSTSQPFEPIIEEEILKDEPEKSPTPKEHAMSIDDLASAIKSIGKTSVGNVRVPEPFTGKDPKKLKPFIFQCLLYFRSSPDLQDDSKRVTFALSYLRDVAQEWFEPGISGLTEEFPPWLDNWDLFVEQLQTNFGPYDETADVEHELMNLRMKDTQRISDYLVRFNSLAVRCPWGESALRYRFYEGLPSRLKDELSKGEGKPKTLMDIRTKAQNIDARYWERVQERSREQQRPNQSFKPPPTPSTSTSTSQQTASTPFRSQDQKPKQETNKSATPKPDLMGKLDAKGKLTPQERQRRFDQKLCLFCGQSGHRVTSCPHSKASAAKGRASTTISDGPPAKGKESEKKKD